MKNSTVSSGTQRALWREKTGRDLADPYAWAMTHRTIGGLPLIHIPALADIMRDDHPVVVIQKSSQVGGTQLLVSLALWAADAGYAGRGNVIYFMPTQNLMDDFTQSRIDQAIQDNNYLRSRLQPEPPRRKGADSKRLKRLGRGHIFLRGADSRRQLAGVDADVVILDEFDEMGEGVLELARRRLGSSRRGLLRIASTPRLPEAGINGLYLQSDQRRYYLPCPGCGLEQALTWEANVDLERAAVVCGGCGEPMNVIAKGRWVPQAPGNDGVHGYHISRLYSPWANIKEMIEASEATTPSALQQFHNSDLGETFSPPGGGIGVDELDRCRREYDLEDYSGQPCDMGVDIGLKQHVVIRERRGRGPHGRPTIPESERNKPRLWFVGEVESISELDVLLDRFNVQMCVVDAQGGGHSAREFALRHKGKVWLALYGRQLPGHEREKKGAGEANIYHINRLEALDATFERFRDGVAELPRNARQLGGQIKDGLGAYYRQVRAPQRTLVRDGQGNWVPRWVDHGRDDHYAHAELYCMMAGKIYGGRMLRPRLIDLSPRRRGASGWKWGLP